MIRALRVAPGLQTSGLRLESSRHWVDDGRVAIEEQHVVILLTKGGDPHMPSQDMGMPLANGCDPHMQ